MQLFCFYNAAMCLLHRQAGVNSAFLRRQAPPRRPPVSMPDAHAPCGTAGEQRGLSSGSPRTVRTGKEGAENRPLVSPVPYDTADRRARVTAAAAARPSSARTSNDLLRRMRQSSLSPPRLLSPPNPLRWASAGAPLCPRAGQHGGGRGHAATQASTRAYWSSCRTPWGTWLA